MFLIPFFSRYAQSTMVTILAVIIFSLFQQTCSAMDHTSCPPSSCGKISNISYPFRLKGDPGGCGLQSYELECVNNVTMLSLFAGEYHVLEIDYRRYEIRVTDAGVLEDTACSFPRYFLYRGNFTYYPSTDALTLTDWETYDGYQNIGLLNCSNPVTNDPRYVQMDTDPCHSGAGGHIYAQYSDLSLMDMKVGCSLKVATFANLIKKWNETYVEYVDDDRNASYADIRKWLKDGFWLTWLNQDNCREHCDGKDVGCYFNQTTQQVQCSSDHYCYFVNQICDGDLPRMGKYIRSQIHGIIKRLWSRITSHAIHNDIVTIYIGRNVLPIFLLARFVFGVTLLLGLLIYKWRRRHLSMYESIESFLLDNDLNPIRYEYKEIKKMTGGFKVKLGQGGFGSVYKGKLRSGPDVAIKMLSKSKSDGQDFINEVATIGRIHHVNIVRLIGYCFEGEKRALVYEYMPNGSLDKYIFSKEGSVPLSYEKTYEISLGVAHGIAYLHQGCDVQILHFDIKPHNILLDENFIPKVSDFGLAKLYPVDNSIVTLTAARGTLGYMAPELFYKNVGGVSYKADVYSFGMLLMEMTSRRKNSNPCVEYSSQHYFPLWIYDQFKEEKDVEMEDASEEDMTLTKRMFIVALWCIQLKPSDRPSMNKVVEMLEGKIENLEMPPRPSFYPYEMSGPNVISSFDQTTTWSDSTSSDTNLSEPINNARHA
ncbi:rust resistance kinase Lr10 isoform X2 [Cajanus cajan]|uniref:rust resistance kinase Lr10 isoform X2 n=1 Tax=Cajanus cajan TaxID=3821 RepID=UPI00098DC3DE|nr:rust resistance kinase Lr10 isoform X2 [Cajanus cajan]